MSREELYKELLSKTKEELANLYLNELEKNYNAREYCKTEMYTYGIKNNREQRDRILIILGDEE